MIKYLQHIQYEWPFIFLFIYVVLQAFYNFNLWLILPVIVIALRIISLGNLKTVITVAVMSIFEHISFKNSRNYPLPRKKCEPFYIRILLMYKVMRTQFVVRGKFTSFINLRRSN